MPGSAARIASLASMQAQLDGAAGAARRGGSRAASRGPPGRHGGRRARRGPGHRPGASDRRPRRRWPRRPAPTSWDADAVAAMAGERGLLVVAERAAAGGGHGRRSGTPLPRPARRGGWRHPRRGRATRPERRGAAAPCARRLAAGPGRVPRDPAAAAGRLDRRAARRWRGRDATCPSRSGPPSPCSSGGPMRRG